MVCFLLTTRNLVERNPASRPPGAAPASRPPGAAPASRPPGAAPACLPPARGPSSVHQGPLVDPRESSARVRGPTRSSILVSRSVHIAGPPPAAAIIKEKSDHINYTCRY
nr:transmembrane protease serine 13-like [Procambarus clarkii]